MTRLEQYEQRLAALKQTEAELKKAAARERRKQAKQAEIERRAREIAEAEDFFAYCRGRIVTIGNREVTIADWVRDLRGSDARKAQGTEGA